METTATLSTAPATQPPILDGLQTVQEAQQARARIFPSPQSFEWYVRQNRKALEAAGAMLFIAGRRWIEPQSLDRFVIEQGRAAQRQRVA